MTRRTVFGAAAAITALEASGLQAAPAAGRLKQSAARWCYSKIALDDLCAHAARIGLKGIDLVNHDEWPVLQKHGLTPAMTPGAGNIANAWNRKDAHDRLEKEMRENIER